LADLGQQQRVEAKHLEGAFSAVQKNLERVWQWRPRATARKFHREKSNSNRNFESTKERTQKRSKDYLLTTEITEEHTCWAGFNTADQERGRTVGSAPENSDLRVGESFVCFLVSSGDNGEEREGFFIAREGTLVVRWNRPARIGDEHHAEPMQTEGVRRGEGVAPLQINTAQVRSSHLIWTWNLLALQTD